MHASPNLVVRLRRSLIVFLMLLFCGSAGQFLNQLAGLGFTILYSGVAAMIILRVVGLITPLRVSRKDEDAGLDISEHGENAYND